jgi:LmbE family N-acetylglucosaminyl deacetylase
MKTIVVAPHADDEILGCGGTLLRRKAEGGEVAWLLLTEISSEHGWPEDQVSRRRAEIEEVRKMVGFDRVYQLRLAPARLDSYEMSHVVAAVAEVFKGFGPEEVLVPYPYDAHSDHKVAFDAAVACTKWFRYPSIRRVLAYETLSETDVGLDPSSRFSPNVFLDIGEYLSSKTRIMETYASEVGGFPFPRSRAAIESLARVRGAASGFAAAEAFELLVERA